MIEFSMNGDAAIALVCGVLGFATLVLTHLRERNPGPSTSSRLTTLETDVAELKAWRSS